jgi:uncharacterized membrane protein required for colicin V production
MDILGLNTLDLLLIVILFIGILIGFVRGALVQVFALISIWLGLVTTLWLYKPFSTRILQAENGLGLSKTAGDTLAFLVLLLVFYNLYNIGVRYLSKPPEERKKRKKKSKVGPIEDVTPSSMQRFVYGPINALGGILMGFIMTTLWLALILGVLQFIFQPTATSSAVPYTGFAQQLLTNLQTSALLPYFNLVLAGLIRSVDLFVPRNADILKGFLNFIATPQ